MITCSSCKHQEKDGALFCSDCGAQLFVDNMKTHAIKKDPTFPLNDADVKQSQQVAAGNAWATLFLVESGRVIPCAERTEYTLGRASEGQPIMPDIDLASEKAYEHGVSRIHAVIKKQASRVVLMDLGSSNGTYLNGVRVMANVENPLVNGDAVSLGKLKIQIVLTNPN